MLHYTQYPYSLLSTLSWSAAASMSLCLSASVLIDQASFSNGTDLIAFVLKSCLISSKKPDGILIPIGCSTESLRALARLPLQHARVSRYHFRNSSLCMADTLSFPLALALANDTSTLKNYGLVSSVQ